MSNTYGAVLASEDGWLAGWALDFNATDTPVELSIYYQDKCISKTIANKYSSILKEHKLGSGNHAFLLKLPKEYVDKAAQNHISVKVSNDNTTLPHIPDWSHSIKTCVTSSNRSSKDKTDSAEVKQHYKGYVDPSKDISAIEGWAIDVNHPEQELKLDIFINNKKVDTVPANLYRKDIQEVYDSQGLHGFYYKINRQLLNDSFCVDVKIADSDFSLNNAPYAMYPHETLEDGIHAVQALINIISQNKNLTLKDVRELQRLSVKSEMRTLLKKCVFPEVEKLMRASKETGYVARVSQAARSSKNYIDTIDVIIPVYKGIQDTLDCIESVLKAKNTHPYELTVIIDASPERKLTEALYDLQRLSTFTLLENDENQGFVRTVNRGMRLHDDRDVVLLNADTQVYDYWLDRLRTAANCAPTIGTVTPFSNNAEICSYPAFCKDNDAVEGFHWKELDRHFATKNVGEVIDIPTAIGFCMYIKRQCLDEIGLFDDDAFGRGYGEENDFCRRAYKHGWRSVLATDTFVYHKGGASFGEEKQQLIEDNLVILNEKHPGYSHIIQQYISRDPIHEYRREIDIARIAASYKQTMLQIGPGLTKGGTNRHIEELSTKLANEEESALTLFYRRDGSVVLKHNILNDLHSLHYRKEELTDNLVADLKKIGVWHIHYHHFMNLPDSLLDMPKLLGIAYDFTAHDYFTICPRINLIDETDSYCGEPKASVCENCVMLNGPHEFIDLQYYDNLKSMNDYKAKYGYYLTNARHVYTPSFDTKSRLEKHFKLDNVMVREHHQEGNPRNLARTTRQKEQPIRVAIIGAIGRHKGSHIIKNCALNAIKHSHPLEFVIIGYTDIDDELTELTNVEILGEYKEEDIWGIIEHAQCDIAFLPSVWPETFSYTLSIAFEASLYPVTFDIGAFTERIKDAKYGTLIDLESTPDTINTVLIKAGSKKHAATIPQRTYGSLVKDYYKLAA